MRRQVVDFVDEEREIIESKAGKVKREVIDMSLEVGSKFKMNEMRRKLVDSSVEGTSESKVR